MEIIPEDRKEETIETPAITYSDDSDAAWIKKKK